MHFFLIFFPDNLDIFSFSAKVSSGNMGVLKNFLQDFHKFLIRNHNSKEQHGDIKNALLTLCRLLVSTKTNP